MENEREPSYWKRLLKMDRRLLRDAGHLRNDRFQFLLYQYICQTAPGAYVIRRRLLQQLSPFAARWSMQEGKLIETWEGEVDVSREMEGVPFDEDASLNERPVSRGLCRPLNDFEFVRLQELLCEAEDLDLPDICHFYHETMREYRTWYFRNGFELPHPERGAENDEREILARL